MDRALTRGQNTNEFVLDTKPCFLARKNILNLEIVSSINIDDNLAGALVVGGLVHTLLGAGRVVAHGHEGGGREPLAARVGDLVLEKRINFWRTRGKSVP